MSAHRIDVFNFELWQGQPPALVQQQVASHTRPGADGTGQINQGVWAPTTRSRVTAVYQSFADAAAAYNLMTGIVGTGPVTVRWNDIEMANAFGHFYNVDRVEQISLRVHPRLIGPGYDFQGGARLVVAVALTAYVPPS